MKYINYTQETDNYVDHLLAELATSSGSGAKTAHQLRSINSSEVITVAVCMLMT